MREADDDAFRDADLFVDTDEALMKAHPEAGVIYRSSPIYPHECVWFLAHDFKTLMIESKGVLPEYKEFIFSCDMTSAYEYHKKFLQLLQENAGGVWNVKKPSHALWLETIFKVYPDARVVWTHRDPYVATGSLCSIISSSHQMLMGRIDYEWLGEKYPWYAAQHAERQEHGQPGGGDIRPLSNHEFFIRLGRRVIAAISDRGRVL